MGRYASCLSKYSCACSALRAQHHPPTWQLRDRIRVRRMSSLFTGGLGGHPRATSERKHPSRATRIRTWRNERDTFPCPKTFGSSVTEPCSTKSGRSPLLPNTPTALLLPPPVIPIPRDNPHDHDQPLSETAGRDQVRAYIRSASWHAANEPEPTADAPGVPACALQLARPCKSVWVCLFRRVRRGREMVYECVACGHEAERLHRAVRHQRTEWKYKPYACADPGWRAVRSLGACGHVC
jgi:hypothetical protein